MVGIDNPVLDQSYSDPAVDADPDAYTDTDNDVCNISSIEVHDTTKQAALQETSPEISTTHVTDDGHDNQAFSLSEEIT